MAGTAVRGRLTWQTATVEDVTALTASVRTITLGLPGWAGHAAGQHLDVRLTAADGYTAERSYSIASAPGEPVAITVERLDDGEVSPYLTLELRPADEIEVRGPIGGYFVWPGDDPAAELLLIAGGSGVVPFRSILRHRQNVGSAVPVRLVYSARSLPEVIYRAELAAAAAGVEIVYTLTRQQPPGWSGHTGRVGPVLLAEVAWPAGEAPLAYVCGPTPFVETVASGLVDLGYAAQRIKTERYGGAGGS
ncbi:MAG: ferredoxin reductase [Streptosporangiaceae bacterium]